MAKTVSEQNYRFSLREVDTILAALRAWQYIREVRLSTRTLRLDSEQIQFLIENTAVEHGAAMSPSEIDSLCERINCNG